MTPHPYAEVLGWIAAGERLVLLRTEYADAMVAALHGEGGTNEPE